MPIHEIDPVFAPDSKILILGSFPSVKSRQTRFFYGHPQNRFWKLMAFLFQEDVPETIEDKKQLLLRNHIAVWDVIRSCEISGSSDQSIKDVKVNDIGALLKMTEIERIYTNGSKAHTLYQRHLKEKTGIEDVCLPSTSPANAAYDLQRLAAHWKAILGDEHERKETGI